MHRSAMLGLKLILRVALTKQFLPSLSPPLQILLHVMHIFNRVMFPWINFFFGGKWRCLCSIQKVLSTAMRSGSWMSEGTDERPTQKRLWLFLLHLVSLDHNHHQQLSNSVQVLSSPREKEFELMDFWCLKRSSSFLIFKNDLVTSQFSHQQQLRRNKHFYAQLFFFFFSMFS